MNNVQIIEDFFYAVCNSEIDRVKEFIAAGVDCNEEFATNDLPLHVAIKIRNIALIEALLDGGADPNRKNILGQSPVAFAWEEAVNKNINMHPDVRVRALNTLRAVSRNQNPFRM